MQSDKRETPKLRFTLIPIITLFLAASAPVRAQVKDIPTQGELDPILDNANTKLKDFAATLTEFRAEAAALDQERLDSDMNAVRQLQDMIQVTHSGGGGNRGINMMRLLGLTAGIDDMALDAATWKSLAELRMCQQLVQQRSFNCYDEFSAKITMNLGMLREVGGQLFHPTFRMAAAMDEVMLALTASEPSSKAKPK